MSPLRHVADPPTLRVAASLAGALAVLGLVELFPVLQLPSAPVAEALARATEWLLGVLGIAVIREGTTLAHPDGFAYQIAYDCSGLRPAILVAAVLLALPMPWRRRVAGIALGIAAIETVNLARLVHLFWVGVVDPAAFEAMHRVTWNILAVALVAGYLLPWIRGSLGRLPAGAPTHHGQTA